MSASIIFALRLLVGIDLLGYAYTAKYSGHHSRVKASSFIEEPPSVLQTVDSATFQVRARHLALQRQGSPKHNFASVWQYTRSVGMDKKKTPVFISVPNTYAQPMASPQAEESKPSETSARRSITSARKTHFKLQHSEVATTAPARKTAFDYVSRLPCKLLWETSMIEKIIASLSSIQDCGVW